MTLFRSLIRAMFTTDAPGRDTVPTPAERLQYAISFTNHYVAETHAEADMFATMFLCVLQPKEGRLTYANCGHEPPYWSQAGGGLTTLRPTGPAVGAIPGARFGVKEIVMQEDDLLFVFTDGIPDALNAEGRSFDKARLPGLLAGERSPEAVAERVERALRTFVGGAEQFDDITMMVVRRVGNG